MIYQKMSELNTQNFSQYARKMLIDGFIFNLNSCTELKQLIYEINKIGININQIAKRVNESDTIFKSEIKELQESIDEICEKISERL